MLKMQKSKAEGREEAIAMFKAHKGKTYDLLLEALEFTDLENKEDFRVLNHGLINV